jgi:hypothetical protein
MPFVLEENLTSGHYLHLLEDELTVLLDISFHIRQGLYLQQDGAYHNFDRQVTAFPK